MSEAGNSTPASNAGDSTGGSTPAEPGSTPSTPPASVAPSTPHSQVISSPTTPQQPVTPMAQMSQPQLVQHQLQQLPGNANIVRSSLPAQVHVVAWLFSIFEIDQIYLIIPPMV
jgi:hypothetical protein